MLDGRRRSRILVSAPCQSVGSSSPDAARASGVLSRSSPSIQWYSKRPMSHIQYPLTSGLCRGVFRMSRAPFAHSGFALIHAVVLQPLEQNVQIVSTA